jgi:hypothetical protein
MRFHAAMAVGLKCALGHRDALLLAGNFSSRNFALTASIDFTGSWVRNPAPSVVMPALVGRPSKSATRNEKNVRQPQANAASQTQKFDIHPHVVAVSSAPLVTSLTTIGISFTTIGATLSASTKVM